MSRRYKYVPLEVMRACARAIDQSTTIARLGNPNAASDVKVALELLRAGLRGALANVEINLGSVKDKEYAAHVKAETENLIENAEKGVRSAGL